MKDTKRGKKMKIDLHVHTMEVSRCGKIAAQDIVKMYKEAGYDAICITNHFSTVTVNWLAKQGKFDFVKAFDEGYELARQYGKEIGLRVFKGYELRCNENDNDFLAYKMPKYLLDNYEKLLALPMKDFLTVLRDNGVKLYQAHPFRNGIKIVDPGLLDGIEVYNGHVGHNSRNPMAHAWADLHTHLRQISGSDCHETYQLARGGIITDWDVKNEDELLACLDSGEYTLIETK